MPAPRARPVLLRPAQDDLRTGLAFFLVGCATFSLIYCVQPLLQDFALGFRISPAQSALSLSLTTGLLAPSILLMGAVGERFSRRGLMFASMCGAALLGVLAAFSPTWPALLLARAAQGVVLGGVPAIAMAALAEQLGPRDLGRAMGVYVGGTAFGGMAGRVGTGLLAEATSWRAALCVLGLIGLLAALGFRWLLPAAPGVARAAPMGAREHLRVWRGHLGQRTLAPLFLLGFINLGVFVAVFNYLGFRLLAVPYHLSPAALSLLFSVYLFGVVGSPLGGAAADRFGRARVVLAGLGTSLAGLLLTLTPALPGILLGLILLTAGFFVTHAVASGWVGAAAPSHKGHASSLYLLAYYLGSSVLGLAGGWFWAAGGWPLVVLFGSLLLVAALGQALRLARMSALR